MRTRVVFEFSGSPSPDDPEWRRIQQFVEGVGGSQLRPAHPELKGIATFVVPDGLEPADVLSELSGLGAVGRVEIDAVRSAVVSRRTSVWLGERPGRR